MPKYDCIAMLLAGGEGKRLGDLTKKNAKPAVLFGGKYRIIDFSLSNCANSGIDTIGVLIQYEPLILNSYVGTGKPWDLHRKKGGVSILPPYVEKNGVRWYKGTANAIFQNIFFIEQYNPRYVLILSGDHIYKMDYREMLKVHIEKQADITIAVKEVLWNDASRFGIMSLDSDNRITQFQEKPKKPLSNLASMGIYIFNWEVLKKYLLKDNNNQSSSNDFGKDIIPLMLKEECKMQGFNFSGYWRDVGTLKSYWEANMDLLADNSSLNLYDTDWQIYSSNHYYFPQYIGSSAKIVKSLINEGCRINGTVENSIIFSGVTVKKGSKVKNSIIMPNVKIGKDVTVNRVIVTENIVIPDNSCIENDNEEIILVQEGFKYDFIR